MSNSYSLVNNEFASNFITTHRTEAQLKATFGDPARFHEDAYTPIVMARNAMVVGVEYIEALVRDPTRTEVAKHQAAKKVADKAIAQIDKSAAALGRISAALDKTAEDLAAEAFEVDPNRSAIHTEIRGWIRDTMAKDGGPGIVRAAMKENVEVAAVLYNSPNFLLNMNDDGRARMVADGVEAHLPKAANLIAEAGRIAALQPRYRTVVKAIEQSFYSKALADQASLRVDMDA